MLASFIGFTALLRRAGRHQLDAAHPARRYAARATWRSAATRTSPTRPTEPDPAPPALV